MLAPFLPIVQQSLREPREAASTLLSMGVPKQVLWPAFALIIVLSVLFMFLGGPPTGPNGQEIGSPFAIAFTSALGGAASVFLVWKVGEFMGGRGKFDETLLLTVFLQGVFFAGQIVGLFLLILVPPLGLIFNLALVLFWFWLTLNFIAVLHGFASLWRALGVWIFATIGTLFVLVFAMSLAGVRIAGTP